uniref:Uncharacterized protein n=1 Tax=Polynucleobacter necessarius subsp. necessarius (strain STIR1) TaxID=452638 RepID=B1XSW3_POLNS
MLMKIRREIANPNFLFSDLSIGLSTLLGRWFESIYIALQPFAAGVPSRLMSKKGVMKLLLPPY